MKRFVAAVLLLAVGCGTAAAPTDAPGTDNAPTQPALATRPTTGPTRAPDAHDVLTYRGDSARTGAMPGPGPSRDQQVVWQYQAGGPIGSSPAVVDGVVFVVSGDGVVHALEIASGAETWSKQLEAEAGAASPLVVGGSLFVGDMAGKFHALSRTDGREVWALQADGPISGAAGSAGELVIFATTAATAYAVGAASGEIAWQSTLPGGVSRSIAVTADRAYFGAAGGWLVALSVADGSAVWQTRVASSGQGGTPAVGDGLVLGATGISTDELDAKGVVAVEAASGEMRWHYANPGMFQVFTPAIVDGVAYVVGQDAVVAALESRSGDKIWSAQTSGPNSALPSIADGILYVPTNTGSVHAFDARTGAQVWEADVIAGQPYAPVVTGGYVLVGTSRGVLYAIGDKTEGPAHKPPTAGATHASHQQKR